MENFETPKIGTVSAHDFMGKNGFFWWIGVVEDRNDPLALGRAKVRIFGYHTSDQTLLPTNDLPWAMPLAPLHNPAGVKAPFESTWVLGFFLDGQIAQQPVMLGAFNGFRLRDVIDAKQFDQFPNIDI